MIAEQYRREMGRLFKEIGRPTLEGKFVGLLLSHSEPVTLAEVARTLHVSKGSVSTLANDMLERGDLKRTGQYSTREHLYQLVDDASIDHLRVMRDVSREMARLCTELAGDPLTTDMKAVKQLRHTADLHTRVSLEVERVLRPEERAQQEDLEHHVEKDWDAIVPPAA